MENVTRKRVNANARQGTKERTAASRYLVSLGIGQNYTAAITFSKMHAFESVIFSTKWAILN